MQRGYLHIPVQHLTDEPFRLTLECAAGQIGLTEYVGNITVDAAIRRVDRRLRLECTIRGIAELLCDRCAEPFAREYTTSYEQWYVIDAHPESVDEEGSHAINPEQRYVVIDDDVRESLLVALPMKRLCREDCLGLCPQCGRNRNLDPCSCEEAQENPLWAGLKNIRN